MAIQTVGGLDSILNKAAAKEWSGKANFESVKSMGWDEITPTKLRENPATGSFGEMLAQSIEKVNGMQVDADKAIQRLASGESKNIHETMLAVEQAEIAFKTMNQVRSKVIDAYREIMRMQV